MHYPGLLPLLKIEVCRTLESANKSIFQSVSRQKCCKFANYRFLTFWNIYGVQVNLIITYTVCAAICYIAFPLSLSLSLSLSTPLSTPLSIPSLSQHVLLTAFRPAVLLHPTQPPCGPPHPLVHVQLCAVICTCSVIVTSVVLLALVILIVIILDIAHRLP